MLSSLNVTQLALIAVGGLTLAAVTALRPSGRLRRAAAGIVAVVAVLSVFAYTNLGRFHTARAHGTHVFHYHDLWHYALGAKYYPELDYDRLYDCTLVALDELGREGVPVPRIEQVRVLSDPMTFYEAEQKLPTMRQICHDRFSDERWAAFKADQATWLSLGWEERWWQVMLFDLGFNPPPTWNVIAHPPTRVIPLTPLTMELLPFVDLVLLFGITSLVVYRTWGPWALAGWLLVLGTNNAASYGWTGGSYCRQLWVGVLVCGLAAAQRERWRAAGVLLGLAASLRVFPVLFLAGALAALAWPALRDRRARRALLELGGGAAATIGVLVALSLVMFDPALWDGFLHKIRQHGATYFVWHLGFQKWATFGPAVPRQDFWWGAGLERFALWNEMLRAEWAYGRVGFELLRASLVLAALGLAARRPVPEAALLFGGTAMFCLTMPANYYYVWLAAIPAVGGVTGGAPRALRLLALFATLAVFAGSRLETRDDLLQNFWWNRALLGFFVAWLATAAAEDLGVRGALGRLAAFGRARPAAVGLAALALVALAVALRRPDHRPNLVLIVIDTLRADRLGAYGYPRPTSPNIDRLAAEGTVFERAYAHAPWTAPSTASVMTSLVPRDHGVVSWDRALADDHLTLAEHLRSEGWQTLAAVSHVVFRRGLGFEQGFERYDTSALGLGHPEKAISSRAVTDSALRLLDTRRPGQPFFLWAHFFDPHYEYVEHPGRTFRAGESDAARLQRWSDAYDSEIGFTDHHVGRLLAGLEERGLAGNTVIALVADHGEEFGDHGDEQHARQLFDEVVRVPMIVRAPGLAPGRRAEVVPTSDLAPTLVSLLGLPVPEAFTGRPVPVAGGALAPEGHRPVVIETVRYADKRGFVRWPHKLVVDRERGTVHLYDLAADPLERVDLAAALPQVRDALLAELDAHYAVERAAAPARAVGPEERAALEALGYVE